MGGSFIPKAASKTRATASAKPGKPKQRRRPESSDGGNGFDRLEAAVAALAKSHGHLRAENAKLRRELGDATRHVRTLDSQLIAANQRRQDASKRIDELIAHLDHLDSQLDQELEERVVPGAPEDG